MLDNDGTLWCERPTYVQFEFFVAEPAIRRCDRTIEQRPEFPALLSGDARRVADLGPERVVAALGELHSGITPEVYRGAVRDFVERARHRLGCPVTATRYQPMLELLASLRRRQFTVAIVTGGGVEFVRGERTFVRCRSGVGGRNRCRLFDRPNGRLAAPHLLAVRCGQRGRSQWPASRRTSAVARCLLPETPPATVRCSSGPMAAEASRSSSIMTMLRRVRLRVGVRLSPRTRRSQLLRLGTVRIASMRDDWSTIFCGDVAPSGRPRS